MFPIYHLRSVYYNKKRMGNLMHIISDTHIHITPYVYHRSHCPTNQQNELPSQKYTQQVSILVQYDPKASQFHRAMNSGLRDEANWCRKLVLRLYAIPIDLMRKWRRAKPTNSTWIDL